MNPTMTTDGPSDSVTDRLRRDLLTGQIKPGERIKVNDLEKRYEVSHIPIREALRRLESEGLVVAPPQRPFVAAGVDLDDLAALYDLRRLVELPVMARAAAAMTDDDLAVVRVRLAELEDAAVDIEAPAFWEAHRGYHWALVAPGASAWIERVLDRIWAASERYVRLFVSETVEDAMRDHRELLVLCTQRDGAGAAALLRRHLDRTETKVRRAFAP